MDIEFKNIETNGVTLRTALAGPERGEPIILLHGFPDHWMAWRKQIGPLAEAGYRVIVPDQRGYNLSSKPSGPRNYKYPLLIDDIVGLAKALGYDRFNLIGHDWGAAVAWGIALKSPLNVKKLIIINAPIPCVFREFMKKNVRQMRRSWYMGFFQIPILPELSIKRQFKKLVDKVIPGLSPEEKTQYLEALNQPRALTCMLNWYRAIKFYEPKPHEQLNVVVPTLILWGKKDRYLRPELAELSRDKCDMGKLVLFDKAGHWVMVEEAERVNELILNQLSS